MIILRLILMFFTLNFMKNIHPESLSWWCRNDILENLINKTRFCVNFLIFPPKSNFVERNLHTEHTATSSCSKREFLFVLLYLRRRRQNETGLRAGSRSPIVFIFLNGLEVFPLNITGGCNPANIWTTVPHQPAGRKSHQTR